MQWSFPLRVASVDIGLLLEQELNHVRLVLIGSANQSCPRMPAFGVDVLTPGQEGFDNFDDAVLSSIVDCQVIIIGDSYVCGLVLGQFKCFVDFLTTAMIN